MQKCAKNEKEIQQNGAKMKKSFQMFARAVWKDKLILCGIVVFLGVLAVAIYQDKELWFDKILRCFNYRFCLYRDDFCLSQVHLSAKRRANHRHFHRKKRTKRKPAPCHLA